MLDDFERCNVYMHYKRALEFVFCLAGALGLRFETHYYGGRFILGGWEGIIIGIHGRG